MLNALINRLRPRDNSVDAIEASIAETDRALANTRAEVNRPAAVPGTARLSGGVTAEQHAADLASARAEVERLEAMRGALVAKRDSAREDARRSRVSALISAATAKHDAFCAWHAAEYQRAAGTIAKGCLLEQEALEALKQARRAMGETPGDWPALPADTLRSVLPGAPHSVGALGDLVQLPPARWDRRAEPVRWWPLPQWSPTGAIGATAWSDDLDRRRAEGQPRSASAGAGGRGL